MGEHWTIEKAMKEPPPPFHPLGGCDWSNFRAHLSGHGQLAKRTRGQRIRSSLAVITRQPFTFLEKVVYSRKVERYELPSPPTFLIGHWRSGTTHLHNLLSTASHFSTIDFGQTAMPHNLLNVTRFMGRSVLSMVIPKDRGMDRVRMSIREPQEEEMALGNLNPVCYYNTYYYPQEMKEQFERSIFFEGLSEEAIANFEGVYVRLLKKLSIVGKGKPLLLKNPASTARIVMLDRLFPGVRFVHIMRNPYEVFASMLHHYPRLFHAFAWQQFDNIDIEEMVFYKYQRLMEGFLEQRDLVKDRLLETTYEKLIADPVEEVSRLYDGFALKGKDKALAEIVKYGSKRPGYMRNKYKITRTQLARIQSEWGFALHEWNYDVPDSIEIV